MKPKKISEKEITIPPIAIDIVTFKCVGDSPLIAHNFSEEAIQEIEDKQTGAAKQAKKPRDPVAEFKSGLYVLPQYKNRYFFPVMAFKKAAVRACSHLDDITMTSARGTFHVMPGPGGMIEIKSKKKPIMRRDMVNIGKGNKVMIPRWRPMFEDWEVELRVRFNSGVISAAQVVNIFNTAGFTTGIGNWRPECNGSFGMFHVDGMRRQRVKK